MSEMWTSIEKSPHAKQAKHRKRTDVPFVRYLTNDFPLEQYKSRGLEIKSTIHWGQRKLLLTEIEFLTTCGSCENSVIYAGAASGTHLSLLAEMFPQHKFYCYDPAPFNVRELPNLFTYQILFTDELALALCGQNVLFISDIRAINNKTATTNDVTDCITTDMDDQQRWVAIMQPVAALLKFNLPWKPGKTTYLDGRIMLPVFGPVTGTETRLLVVCNESLNHYSIACTDKPMVTNTTSSSSSSSSSETAAAIVDEKIDKIISPDIKITKFKKQHKSKFLLTLRDYDHTLYENQLFFFNHTMRSALFPHDIDQVQGLDHCYDCSAEVHIINNYCKHVLFMSAEKKEALKQRVTQICDTITSELSSTRTLASPNVDKYQRKQSIRQRQWTSAEGPPSSFAQAKRLKQIEDGMLPMLIATSHVPTAPPLIELSGENRFMLEAPCHTPESSEAKQLPLTISSATTFQNPYIDRIRQVLERKSEVYDLNEAPELFNFQQTESDCGWMRAELKATHKCVYVNKKKYIYSFVPPSIYGWLIRSSNEQSDVTYWYENAHTQDISIDVPLRRKFV